MKYEAGRAALRHLLETCEQFENTKRRMADMPEAMRDRNVTQTESLRLHVACGSWVMVRKKGVHQTVDDIFDALDRYDVAIEAITTLSRGVMTKSAMNELIQDTAATLGLIGNSEIANPGIS